MKEPTLKVEPQGSGSFVVTAPSGYPFRLTVVTEARRKGNGSIATVILDLHLSPVGLVKAVPITKGALRELPLKELEDVGSTLHATDMAGRVIARPVGLYRSSVERQSRKLDNAILSKVAEAARVAALDRFQDRSAPSVERALATQFDISVDTAKYRLKIARTRGFLVSGELRAIQRGQASRGNVSIEADALPSMEDIPSELRFTTYLDDEDGQ